MSSIGIIPIRYKSIRLPGKTFQTCASKPLIEWTLDKARVSKLDDIIVATSCVQTLEYCDNKDIRIIERPIGLEADNAPVIDTISWLNEKVLIGYDIQMLLQITNPTRTAEDINACLDILQMETANSVCSVTEIGEYHPSRMYLPITGLSLRPLEESNQWIDRGKLPKLLLRDGAIYAWKTKAFQYYAGRTLLPQRIMRYDIPKERSVRIDTKSDLLRAEQILTNPVPSVESR